MKIRKADINDVEKMLEIYNYEVVNGVATLDIKPKTLEEWTVWFCILTTLFIFAVMFSPFYTKSAHVYHVRFNVFIIPYYIQLVYCPMILTAQSGSL